MLRRLVLDLDVVGFFEVAAFLPLVVVAIEMRSSLWFERRETQDEDQAGGIPLAVVRPRRRLLV
jgi:hypothetical protein